MRRIGLIFNEQKKDVLQTAQYLIQWLEDRRVKVFLTEDHQKALGKADAERFETTVADNVDCVLVLGGDGTLLSTARALAVKGTPILGINMGQLGFLTEIELPSMFEDLELLLRGEYLIEERMMLEARVVRNNTTVDRFLALNDVVVTKGSFSRMIYLETYVSQHYVDTYRADGLIVSSPTGSTAYCMSAGGPLVSPEVEVMIIVPICPHTLYARPLVVASHQEIKVVVRSKLADVAVTVDGQHGVKLEENDEITVGKAPFKTKLIRLKGRNFYEVLREKLRGEGGGAYG
ncbi:NAD(+)/NADH kinase [Calderihabitans maritimus]|uniref:NAD kinase n=1 Tax=Calderihabitans maritimus TaxID=1246530 RepID=A0A1Z5HSQ2_9FIRM|nr:NAD(+)/NADH kinase [Calderihabitans maritimus]GAW92310.1 ATP-NAD/AcoX kinase [Calderihabitans maritimus]